MSQDRCASCNQTGHRVHATDASGNTLRDQNGHAVVQCPRMIRLFLAHNDLGNISHTQREQDMLDQTQAYEEDLALEEEERQERRHQRRIKRRSRLAQPLADKDREDHDDELEDEMFKAMSNASLR